MGRNMRSGNHRSDMSTRYITFMLTLVLVPLFWTSVCCAAETVAVSGNVTYNGEPVTAMVLANGQYMFTDGGEGRFDLTNVPLDSNGEITLYAFCSGLSPYKTTLIQGVSDLEIKLKSEELLCPNPVQVFPPLLWLFDHPESVLSRYH